MDWTLCKESYGRIIEAAKGLVFVLLKDVLRFYEKLSEEPALESNVNNLRTSMETTLDKVKGVPGHQWKECKEFHGNFMEEVKKLYRSILTKK